MLRLLLLRHAEAEAPSGGADIERRLAPAGRVGATLMGAYFNASQLNPDLVLVSPARRADETLDLIEGELSQKFARAVEPTLYNASASTRLALLTQTPLRIKVLMVVGHNPGLAETANALASDGDRAQLAKMRGQFPPPCLAAIDFEENDWRCARTGRGWLDRFVTLATLSDARAAAQK